MPDMHENPHGHGSRRGVNKLIKCSSLHCRLAKEPIGPSRTDDVLRSMVQLRMEQCDAACADDVQYSLKTPRSMPFVAGVLLSGGVLADTVLLSQTAASVRAVCAPKSASAATVQGHATRHPIDQIVMHSSAAALFGVSGQANYAAANGAIEGIAAGLSASGVRSLAIQWGAWAAGKFSRCLRSILLWISRPLTL